MDESAIDRLVERIDKLTGFMEIKEVKNNAASPYLTAMEAAKYLRISKVTLMRLISAGKIKCYKLQGKILLKTKDLDAFVENSTKDSKYDVIQRSVNGGRGRR